MTSRAVAELVVRMAGEHPTWGYTRVRSALANLGHHIARNTVKRILRDHGIAAAPERNRRTPWKTFLQAHWKVWRPPIYSRSRCSPWPVFGGISSSS